MNWKIKSLYILSTGTFTPVCVYLNAYATVEGREDNSCSVIVEHCQGLCGQESADSPGGHEVGPQHHALSPDRVPAEEGHHHPGAVPAQWTGPGHTECPQLRRVQRQLQTTRGEG